VYIAALAATTVASVYWFSNILLPLFYGVPKVARWCRRPPFSWWLAPHYLFAPLFWLVLPVIAGYILAILKPTILLAILNSAGFTHGQILGFVLFVGSILFSQDTRQDLKNDFISVATRYPPPGPSFDEFTAIHCH
jgi:hypothetical protein